MIPSRKIYCRKLVPNRKLSSSCDRSSAYLEFVKVSRIGKRHTLMDQHPVNCWELKTCAQCSLAFLADMAAFHGITSLSYIRWCEENCTRERHTNSSANPTPVVPNPSSSPLIISLTPSYSKPICWQRSCREWDPTVHTGIHASPCWKRAMRILTDSDFRCDQFCR